MQLDLNQIAAADPNFVNENSPEFMGMQSICATSMFDSSSRAQMHTSHFSQRIVMNEHDEKIMQTGIEKKLSPFTFNVKMPESGRIRRIIHKYDPKGGINIRGRQHTKTIVIFQREKDNQIDYFEIPYFMSNHQIFGFKYVPNQENLAKIQPGAFIRKGTIFADAPTVGENGAYDYGKNANVAFMSMKAVAEDGFVISDRYLQRSGFKITESRTFGIGRETFIKNLYGRTADEVKPIPDLGENVREDGLLAVRTKYDPDLTPVEMSKFDMQEINYIFDQTLYVKSGGGRIVDITVIRNNETIKKHPNEISQFLDKYADAYVEFNRNIYETYLELKRESHRATGIAELNISPAFHALVVDAMAICNVDVHKVKQPLRLMHRKQPIDEYHVEIVVEHDITPDTAGFKWTDQHGGNK